MTSIIVRKVRVVLCTMCPCKKLSQNFFYCFQEGGGDDCIVILFPPPFSLNPVTPIHVLLFARVKMVARKLMGTVFKLIMRNPFEHKCATADI